MWSRVFLLFLCPRVAPALLHLYRRCKFSHFRNWNWKKLVNVISELTRNNWNYFRESVRFRMIDFTGYFLLTADPSGNCCVFMFMFLLRVPWGGRGFKKAIVYRNPWEQLKISSMSVCQCLQKHICFGGGGCMLNMLDAGERSCLLCRPRHLSDPRLVYNNVLCCHQPIRVQNRR